MYYIRMPEDKGDRELSFASRQNDIQRGACDLCVCANKTRARRSLIQQVINNQHTALTLYLLLVCIIVIALHN